MGVMQSLTVTAYIKMVDIWILFTMFYPFLSVSLYTIKELLKNKVKKVSGSWVEDDERKIIIVDYLLSWGLPLLMSIFTIIYWTVGLLNYVYPDLHSVC
jgi:hypothetical protein